MSDFDVQFLHNCTCRTLTPPLSKMAAIDNTHDVNLSCKLTNFTLLSCFTHQFDDANLCKYITLGVFDWAVPNVSILSYARFFIVIAIGDDYRFAFFGLVTKLWLKFQGLFISLRIVDFTFLLQNWLNVIT